MTFKTSIATCMELDAFLWPLGGTKKDPQVAFLEPLCLLDIIWLTDLFTGLFIGINVT